MGEKWKTELVSPIPSTHLQQDKSSALLWKENEENKLCNMWHNNIKRTSLYKIDKKYFLSFVEANGQKNLKIQQIV